MPDDEPSPEPLDYEKPRDPTDYFYLAASITALVILTPCAGTSLFWLGAAFMAGRSLPVEHVPSLFCYVIPWLAAIFAFVFRRQVTDFLARRKAIDDGELLKVGEHLVRGKVIGKRSKTHFHPLLQVAYPDGHGGLQKSWVRVSDRVLFRVKLGDECDVAVHPKRSKPRILPPRKTDSEDNAR